MSKNKKELTPTQQKKRYKRLSRICFGGEFLATLTPFVSYALANYEKYFVQVDGWKLSIAFYLGLALMGIAVWLVAKKKYDNTFVTLIIGWAAITFIFYLMGQMIQDIVYIMAFGLIGLICAGGLDYESNKLNEKAKKIDEAIEQANKENLVDAYKTELVEKEEKKIKVKIKK